MAEYEASASVTSAPTNVSLKIDGMAVKMERDAEGAWVGSAQLDLPNNVPIEFRAVGIASAPWTLEIKFSPPTPEGAAATDFKHEGKIPPSMLSIFADKVALKSAEAVL